MKMELVPMQRTEARIEGEWKAAALDAIYKVARRHLNFTTDDVWAELVVSPSRERDNRALGSVMREASRLRYCRSSNTTRKTKRASNHRWPLAVWTSLINVDRDFYAEL